MTAYIIVVTNQDGTSCTSVFENVHKFRKELEILEEMFYDGTFIGLKTSIETEYERYPVDDYDEEI